MEKDTYIKYIKEIYDADLSMIDNRTAALKGFDFGINVANSAIWHDDKNPPYNQLYFVNIEEKIYFGKRSKDDVPCIYLFDNIGNVPTLAPISLDTNYYWGVPPEKNVRNVSFDFNAFDKEVEPFAKNLSNKNDIKVITMRCTSNDMFFDAKLQITKETTLRYILEIFCNFKNICHAIWNVGVELMPNMNIYIVHISSVNKYDSICQINTDIGILWNKLNTL